jgi:hypothetical protein
MAVREGGWRTGQQWHSNERKVGVFLAFLGVSFFGIARFNTEGKDKKQRGRGRYPFAGCSTNRYLLLSFFLSFTVKTIQRRLTRPHLHRINQSGLSLVEPAAVIPAPRLAAAAQPRPLPLPGTAPSHSTRL